MHRVVENQRKQPDEEPMPKFREAWRRFGQAVDRYNVAKEAEDFQAVGNHLRECLLALARDHADAALVGKNEPTPKLGDFKGWSALLASSISDGRLRDYLKELTTSTWDFVQVLVHDRNSHRYDAEIALDATSHLLGVFGMAVIAHERGDPPRCPNCGSYQLASDWRKEEDLYYTVCGACGWEELDEESNSRPRPTEEQVEAYLSREVDGPCTFPPPNPWEGSAPRRRRRAAARRAARRRRTGRGGAGSA